MLLSHDPNTDNAETAAAMATEEGEGNWKTSEALPWEGSDRDYTYEEVLHISLMTCF